MKNTVLEKAKINISGLMDMTNEMEFNQICLLTGKNGTGKTIVLKMSFAVTFGLLTYSHLDKSKTTNQDLINLFQFSFDNTFDNNDFTGKIEFIYTKNVDVTIEFEKGKITSANILNEMMIDDVTQVKYLSSQMRTFTAINSYLKLRKRIAGEVTILDPKGFENMLEDYKLYDILRIEELIIKSPISIPEQTIRSFIDNFDFTEDNTPREITVDLNKGNFNVKTNAGERLITSYSAGEQSLINMLMANI